MAKVKALTSFAGIVSMSANQIGEITDEAILSDLLRAGYVEELEATELEATELKATELKAPKTPAKSSKKKGDK